MAFNVGTLIGYLQLNGIREFRAGVTSAQESLDLTAKTAQRTAAAVDASGKALAGAGKQADVAAAGSARYKAAQLSLVAAQERYNKLLADSNVSTGRLASTQASLIRAQQRVSDTQPITPAAISNIDKMSGRIRTVIGDTAKMAAGFAVIGAAFEIGKAVKQANDFQRQMLLIQTQAHASAGEVKAMTGAVLGLSSQVATGPEQLAVSLYHIESVGLRGSQALDVLKTAAEGAKIGNADLEQTTNALTSTVASGIPGVQNMTQAMGMLNATVGAGDMKLSDLNDALGSGILSVVKGYGLSLKDVGAALATFGDNNIRGANAATMLRMAVQSMAVPMKTGQASLELLGLKSNTLAHDMQTGGLNKALLDLSAHLKQVGKGQEITDLSNQFQSMNGKVDATTVQASSLGETLTTVFGKRAGPGLAVLLGQMDRLQSKYAVIDQGAGTFASDWAATTKTASFGFDKLRASAEAAGVGIFEKAGPALGAVASDIGVILTGALHTAGAALSPLSGAFTGFAHILEGSGGAAHAVADALHAIEPELRIIGPLVIGTWAGFKAGEFVVATVGRIGDAISLMGAKLAGVREAVAGFWTTEAAAAGTAAATTGTAAAAISEEAAAMSSSIETSGAAARVGWAELAGPLGAAAVGIGVLITLFHKSSSASKDAAAAAKAYSDALKGGGGESTLMDAITSRLSDAKVPENIDKLNKALRTTSFTGPGFVNAIRNGGSSLKDLEANLQHVIDTGTSHRRGESMLPSWLGGRNSDTVKMTAAAKSATQLLKTLKAEAGGVSDAAAKEISDLKAFGQVSSSIDQVSEAAAVGSQTAQTYAAMLGIVVDKNGIAAVSSDTLNKAIKTVSDAENTATATGSDFLDSLQKFSASAGTAADRAAIMQATLKAGNGDNLAFASSMNGLAQATSTFATDMSTGAKNANESVKAYVNSLFDAKTGTIDYNKAAAGPLITNLAGIQSAALAAAGAVYQHNLAQEGGKKAADDAYTVYKKMTTDALSGYLRSIGDVDSKTGKLTTSAQKLVDTYFGMPKDVKTQIEQEGANPVLDVLNHIGQLLANLVHEPWTPQVNVNVDDSQLTALHDHLAALGGVAGVLNLRVSGAIVEGVGVKAAGGSIVGPGTGTSDSVPIMASNGEFVVRASQARKHLRLLNAVNAGIQGFADGGPIGDFTVTSKSSSRSGSSSSAASGLPKMKITIDTSDITKFLRSLTGSASSIASAESTLAKAVTSAGGSSALSHELAGQNSNLMKLADDRKTIADKLKVANTNLASIQKTFDDERTKVAGTITGAFDITSAGFSPQQILSTLTGDKNQAALFQQQLRTVSRLGLSKSLIQQFAEKGVSAEPALLALTRASGAQIAQINSGVSSLGSIANAIGTDEANSLYGSGVNAAKSLVAGLKSQDGALVAAMKHLGDTMVSEIRRALGIHSPSVVMRRLGKFVGQGFALGIADSHGFVTQQAYRLAGGAMPTTSGRGGVYAPVTVLAAPSMDENALGIAMARQLYARTA